MFFLENWKKKLSMKVKENVSLQNIYISSELSQVNNDK